MATAETIAPWERIPDTAHALTVFRALPGGRGRTYTMTYFPRDPLGGIRHFIRMCAKVGWLVGEEAEDWFAVIDVLDADTDIVENFGIRDAAAFQQIKRRLKLAVEYTDGDPLTEGEKTHG